MQMVHILQFTCTQRDGTCTCVSMLSSERYHAICNLPIFSPEYHNSDIQHLVHVSCIINLY